MKQIQLYLVATLLLGVFLLITQNSKADNTTQFQQGIAFNGWWHDAYLQPEADLSLDRLTTTGADWVSLLVVQFQDNIDSTTIFANDFTASDASLAHAVADAQTRGLKVTLKPHLDLWADPDQWRGEIGRNFTDSQWQTWFSNYQTFIYYYAELAESAGVEQFVIGTELYRTTPREAEWRDTIAGVRQRFSGKITYASIFYSGEFRIQWWDALDYIGVDTYYPLTDDDDPTVTELVSAWQAHVADLEGLHQMWQKPVIITEIGYRSLDGAGTWPWNHEVDGEVDLQEQADLYTALFTAFEDADWLHGIYWWEWDSDPFAGGKCDNRYSPQDKPVERVLREWYGGVVIPSPVPVVTSEPIRPIYHDTLLNGWQNWSWGGTFDFAQTNQVYAGSQAIFADIDQWGAVSFGRPAPIDVTDFYWLALTVRTSDDDPQLQIFLEDDAGNVFYKRQLTDCRFVMGDDPFEAETWTQLLIPLHQLGADGIDLQRISIQNVGVDSAEIWLDNIELQGIEAQTYLPILHE